MSPPAPGSIRAIPARGFTSLAELCTPLARRDRWSVYPRRFVKILVTGATGFVGSHAAEALIRAGHDLRLLARTPERVRRVEASRGVTFGDVVQGDMTDATAVAKALDGCDAVLHAAANVDIAARSGIYDDNVAGIRNVVVQAAERGLDPVLYVSSIATMFPPPGPVMKPDDPIAHLETAYGRSKAEGERIVRELQAGGAPIVSIYPSGVIGPDDPGPSDTMKGLRDRLRFGWILTSGGAGCVDVRDLARVATAACAPGRGSRRYMAGGHFLPWADEAALCEDIVGRRVRRIPAPPWLVRAAGRGLDGLKRLFPIDYPLTHEAALFVTQFVPSDDSRTCEELDLQFRPVRETLTDAIRWLVEVGELTPAQAPSLAPRP